MIDMIISYAIENRMFCKNDESNGGSSGELWKKMFMFTPYMIDYALDIAYVMYFPYEPRLNNSIIQIM